MRLTSTRNLGQIIIVELKEEKAMNEKKVKTYSYDEYIKTFYPHQTESEEILFDPHLIGDKLAEKSLKKLQKSFRTNRKSNNKSANNL